MWNSYRRHENDGVSRFKLGIFVVLVVLVCVCVGVFVLGCVCVCVCVCVCERERERERTGSCMVMAASLLCSIGMVDRYNPSTTTTLHIGQNGTDTRIHTHKSKTPHRFILLVPVSRCVCVSFIRTHRLITDCNQETQ